ncbi:hypothetical protein Tco_1377876 [Tanacetum coccineum]
MERVFHSTRRLFKTSSLDYSSSSEFDLFSDLENQSEKEVTKAMAEPTMEEYMMNTREDYGLSIDRPKILEKDHFKLKGQFLTKLRDNTFSGSDNDDANEHIEKALMIVDLFHIPDVTTHNFHHFMSDSEGFTVTYTLSTPTLITRESLLVARSSRRGRAVSLSFIVGADGRLDYPWARGDDEGADDGASSGDVADGWDEDLWRRYDEDEGRGGGGGKHIASAALYAVLPIVELVSSPEGTEPIITNSPDITTWGSGFQYGLRHLFPSIDGRCVRGLLALPTPPLSPLDLFITSICRSV